MKKAANEVDRHVGSRIRMRRMMLGMSQEKLGEALGVTFQQVQKYEKGSNRVSATRLRQIAETQGVGLDFFYEGLSSGEAPAAPGGFAEGVSARYEADVMSPDSMKLLRAFQRIPSQKIRRRLVELAIALSGSQDDPHDRSE